MLIVEAADPALEPVDGGKDGERKHEQGGGNRGGGGDIVIALELVHDQRGNNLGLETEVARDKGDRAVFAHGAGKRQREAGEDGGKSVGARICTKVRRRLAPSVAAASSTSCSMFCRTGCRVRTTKGRPTNVNAMTTASRE